MRCYLGMLSRSVKQAEFRNPESGCVCSKIVDLQWTLLDDKKRSSSLQKQSIICLTAQSFAKCIKLLVIISSMEGDALCDGAHCFDAFGQHLNLMHLWLLKVLKRWVLFKTLVCQRENLQLCTHIVYGCMRSAEWPSLRMSSIGLMRSLSLWGCRFFGKLPYRQNCLEPPCALYVSLRIQRALALLYNWIVCFVYRKYSVY